MARKKTETPTGSFTPRSRVCSKSSEDASNASENEGDSLTYEQYTHKLLYRNEVRMMMYVSGDAPSPRMDSSALVECLTRRYLSEMIVNASRIAILRNARAVSIDDVVFQVRHDPQKLRRLRNYLTWRDVRKKAHSDPTKPANPADSLPLHDELGVKVPKVDIVLGGGLLLGPEDLAPGDETEETPEGSKEDGVETDFDVKAGSLDQHERLRQQQAKKSKLSGRMSLEDEALLLRQSGIKHQDPAVMFSWEPFKEYQDYIRGYKPVPNVGSSAASLKKVPEKEKKQIPGSCTPTLVKPETSIQITEEVAQHENCHETKVKCKKTSPSQDYKEEDTLYESDCDIKVSMIEQTDGNDVKALKVEEKYNDNVKIPKVEEASYKGSKVPKVEKPCNHDVKVPKAEETSGYDVKETKEEETSIDVAKVSNVEVKAYDDCLACTMAVGNKRSRPLFDQEDLATRCARLKMKREDMATRMMNKRDYIAYSECKAASFTHRKIKKFREWLKVSANSEIRTSDEVLEIVGFLGYEYVRSLIEIACYLRARYKTSHDETKWAKPEQFYDRSRLYSSQDATSSMSNAMPWVPPEERKRLQVHDIEEAYRVLSGKIQGIPIRHSKSCLMRHREFL